MATLYVNNFLTWTQVKRTYVNDSGTWTRIKVHWESVFGATWRPVHVYGLGALITTGSYVSINGTACFGYRNYPTGTGSGSNAGSLSTPATLSDGVILGEIGTHFDGNGVTVSVRASSNPGASYLLSAFGGGTGAEALVDTSTATYLYISGLATWTWTGVAFSAAAAGQTYYGGVVIT